MKTLKNDYMVQGIQPRAFVRISDASDNDLLLQGTKAVGDYEDRITDFGPINQSIQPEDGMAEVSGASVNRLVLDEQMTLCTEASIKPQPEVSGGNQYIGAARLLSEGDPGDSYATTRNKTTGNFAEVALVVGRAYVAGSSIYSVYRSVLQFTIPAGVLTCEDAYIELTGLGDFSTTDFAVKIVTGTWTDFSSPTGMFNDFAEWAASGTYTVTALNEAWTSAEYGATVRIRLTAAACALIVAATGGKFRLVMISENDRDAAIAAPTGNEYIQFGAASALLKLRYNSKTLDNQNAEMLIGLETLPATISSTTLDLVWKGVVDSWELNDREMSLVMKQNDHKKSIQIPNSVFTKDIYPYLPDENVGKIIPVIYGDFLTNIYHKEGIPYVANENDGAIIYSHKDYVKAYVYDYRYSYLKIAGHSIKTIDNMLADYESVIKSFSFYAGDVAAIAGTNNKQLEITKNAAAKFPYAITYNAVMPIIGFIPTYFLTPTFTDYDHLIDEDVTNYCTVDPNEIGMDFYLNRDAIISGLGNVFVNRYICFYTVADAGYDTYFKFTAHKYFEGALHADQTVTIIADGWHFINVEDVHITNEILNYMFYFTNLGGVKTIKIYNLSFCVGIKKQIEKCAYIACKGTYDDGTGTVTGTASALIENPAHVIESFVRTEMSLATADIDTTAFDAAATDLGFVNPAAPGKIFAFQLLENENTRTLLDELGNEARLHLWWDEQDRLTCKLIDSTDYFPHSGTDVPGDLDTFSATGAPVDGSFTQHQIIEGLKITCMGADDAKNDFVIHYRKNYATNEYAEVLTVNKDGGNLDNTLLSGTTEAALIILCDTCYDRNLKVSTLELDAWAIRDEATATALMQHLVEWFTTNRYIIEFTAGISAMEFDLGDFVNVRDSRLVDLFGAAVEERKKWMIIGSDPNMNNCTYGIKAIEV